MKIKNQNGKNTVTIILFIAIFSLVLRFAILEIIRSNIKQNESNAAVTLKSISAALENYARNNQGAFPLNLMALAESEPAYLNKNYLATPVKGYSFSCPRLDISGYSCSATPVKCNISGVMIFTITTGGIIVSEDCAKK